MAPKTKSVYACTECGAEIDYYVSCDPIDEEGQDND
mgnify:CR=1 FL=1